MSEYTPNLNLFKYDTKTDGKEVFSIDKALNENWDKLDNFSGLVPGMFVPFFVTEKWIPEGFIRANGATYSKDLFPDVWNDYLMPVQEEGKPPYTRWLTCTPDEYQQEVATKGACTKWAVDTVAGTMRVPFIPNGYHIEQGEGNVYNAGLPNITGRADGMCGGVGSNGTFSSGRSSQWGVAWGGGQLPTSWLDFDASRSNPIYGKSNTVQTDSVSLRWFIYMANVQINKSALDWSECINRLNDEANVLEDKLTDCIIEAPNGVMSFINNQITIKAGFTCLIPIGRNNNLTYKNYRKTMLKSEILNILPNIRGKFYVYKYDVDNTYDYFEQPDVFRAYTLDKRPGKRNRNTMVYVEATNRYYKRLANSDNWIELNCCRIGVFYKDEENSITHVAEDPPVLLLKRTESEYISSLSFPSTKKITISLLPTGQKYIAPANGWFYLDKVTNQPHQYISMVNEYNGMVAESFSSGLNNQYIKTFIPVSKGQRIALNWNAGGHLNAFWFIYAQGET